MIKRKLSQLKFLIMHFIKTLQRLMVSNSTDLKVVCNDNKIIHSHKIIFGLIHVSLAEIFIQDEFTDQKVTIFLPIDSEDLKRALKFDSIEDSTNIINNIFKLNLDSDPEPSKQENNVNFEDVFQKEKESIENDKKMVKKVKLADVEDFSETQDEKLQNKESLKRKHQQRRFVKVNGKYECGQCHKTYTQKSHLTTHIQSIHEGIKYACDQCDQQFTSQGSLTSHIQSKHEGVKYACNQCDYQATTQSSLTVHIKSKHEDVKYAIYRVDIRITFVPHLDP